MRRILVFVVFVAALMLGIPFFKAVGLNTVIDQFKFDPKVLKIETYERQGVPGCDVYVTVQKGAKILLPPEAQLYPVLSNAKVDTYFFESDTDCPPPPPGVKTSNEGPTTKTIYTGLAALALAVASLMWLFRRRTVTA